MDLDWPPRALLSPLGEYERWAPVYDLFYYDVGDDVAFYLDRAAAALPAGGAVLELGSGTGRLAEHLLRAGHTVVGCDASASMLARADSRLARFGDRWQAAHVDVRELRLPQRFELAVAPYGMVAHLLTDADRLAAFRAVHDHLAPGGQFVFDDRPAWLADPADSGVWQVVKTVTDPDTGLLVRQTTNFMGVADGPYTVKYDAVDWLDGDRVTRREMMRVVFRDIALADELALLRAAGFDQIEALGGFDGRPFDFDDPSRAARLILCCRRGHG
ncbi:MAG: class I SAM-dependent methyltransferase [Armatimonadetes bacterium]|nr:class I SAM-dependent methyltransferase [Armatimonadota bacterium]